MRPEPPGSPVRSPSPKRRPRRRWLLLTVMAAVAVLVVWLAGGTHTLREFTVSVDGAYQTLKAPARTVAQALAVAGLELDYRDRVEPDLETPLEHGMTVYVQTARPVSVSVDGRDLRLMTVAPTVGQALDQARLVVNPQDRVFPGLDEPVQDGMSVRVTRVVQTFRHQEETVPFATVRREDMSMDLGQEVEDQPGEDGLRRKLLRVTYEDGQQVTVEELSNEVVRESTRRVVRVGTVGTIVIGGETVRFLKRMDVTATAYEPGPISCGIYADGYTALGLRATRGIIAVDPKVIPFWTRVYVEGYGFAVAADRGSAIIGNRIDVCYDTYGEAMAWGVRRVKLYILELPGR